MKIVILDKKTVTTGDISLAELEMLGDVIAYDLTEPEQIAERIGDADAVLCNKSPLTRPVFEACPNLKYIGLFATGYNNVDMPAAADHGITVCNAGEYSTLAVAQHTFALILNSYSRAAQFNESVQKGDWVRSQTFSFFSFPTYELAGRTLGIFGFGSIGRAVARIGEAFGMNIMVSTRTQPEAGSFPAYRFVTPEVLFEQADVLTLHCPLTEQTKELVNLKNLNRMKETALLINTARGGLVCEADLAKVLNEGRIAGAGLDVVTQEPMRADNPLLGAKNCVITPHTAWAPRETRARLVTIVAGNLKAFQEGRPIHVVK